MRILGIYNDEEILKEGAKHLRSKGIDIANVYSPFPIHGIDEIIGLKRTRISIAAFCYGLTGCSLALLMMWYMNVYDWPMDIGGKPSFALYLNLPAFIPVTFESTVLCTAHGMALTFLLVSKILPGVTAANPDPRSTDDKFIMEIVAEDASKATQIIALLNEAKADEIKQL